MNKAVPHTEPGDIPRVRIITVNWNGFDDTAHLLRRLKTLDYPAFDVVVVDNGSTDGSPDRLADEFPGTGLLRLPENLGFGGANNHAIRQAMDEEAPLVWLLNNDAYPEPEALTRMVTKLRTSERIGAVGAVVMEADHPDCVQAWGGGHFNRWLAAVTLNRGPGEHLDYLTGACCLIRTATLRQSGLFDERLFLYWEDTDLCRRITGCGWTLAVAENARVWHKGSASTGTDLRARSRHSLYSYGLYARRHERFGAAKAFTATLFQSAGKLAKGRVGPAIGCWEGWRRARNAE